MTTFIEPLELTMADREMSPNTSIIFTMCIGACMSGMYMYDMYKKYKETESSIKELEHELGEVEILQQTHSDILQEQEQRIREKKNYDEDDEIDEGKYQAWMAATESREATIQIWREKISTCKKNQEWLGWNGKGDASTIVRDFYLGNSSPEFHWTTQANSSYVEANVSETMVNGWDSVVKMSIRFSFPSEKDLCSFAGHDQFQGNITYNAILKKMIDTNSFHWVKCLIDA